MFNSKRLVYGYSEPPIPFVVRPSSHRLWAVMPTRAMTYARPSTELRTNGIADRIPACSATGEPTPFVVSPSNHRLWAVMPTRAMTYAGPSTELRTNGIADRIPACSATGEPTPFVVSPSNHRCAGTQALRQVPRFIGETLDFPSELRASG